MQSKLPTKKYGFLTILDALGAAAYSEDKIRNYLSARSEINAGIQSMPPQVKGIGTYHCPEIFTFGDTVIIATPLRSRKYLVSHLKLTLICLRRYLYHAFEKGILFRGAFSIGEYIADSPSNTVMGEAVSDAAAWYEEAEWAGTCSTPKAKIVIERLRRDSRLNFDGWLDEYSVPMKNGRNEQLLAVSWPGAFFDPFLVGKMPSKDPYRHFYSILDKLPIPKGTEKKYENTIKFFDHIATRRLGEKKSV